MVAIRMTGLRVVLPLAAVLVLATGARTAAATENDPARSDAATAEADRAACAPAVRFDADDFSTPTRIDNPFLPMTPGTRLTYRGTANRGQGAAAHSVVFTVTDLTKVIAGVRTRVVWDVDRSAGELIESELAFFAQDRRGNVWNLGEYPEEYEDGVFAGAPNTWIAGLDRAVGGVHMLAHPRVGTPEYLQGRARNIEFLDCAQVVERGQTTCVPVRCFDQVLVTHERSPLDPAGGIQTKDHAPGVGIVRIGAIGDPEGETLRLVEVDHLGPAELRAARERALELDRRGHRVSAVYSRTPAPRQ